MKQFEQNPRFSRFDFAERKNFDREILLISNLCWAFLSSSFIRNIFPDFSENPFNWNFLTFLTFLKDSNLMHFCGFAERAKEENRLSLKYRNKTAVKTGILYY